MDALQQLVAQALLGTERSFQGLSKAQGELGHLLDDISNQTPTPDLQILRLAGVFGLAQLAGYQPLDKPGINIDPPSLPTSAPLPKPLLDSLPELFRDSPLRLQLDALNTLIRARIALPAGMLPLVFDLGRKQLTLQPGIKQLAGDAGRWLAQLNNEWSYVLEQETLDQHLWNNGTREQRLDFFTRLRTSDANQARELLATQLTEMDARERVSLVDLLTVGLNAHDEPLLENLLADRSKEVRSSAAGLLGRLPNSRYVRQMIERVRACISQERKLLRSIIKLEPPQVFDPTWKADGIDENRPANEPLGPRAWWLLQLARNLPLSWWEKQLALSPTELLKWAASTEWHLALLRAWYPATLREANGAWANALLEHKLPKEFSWNPFELVVFLPVHEQEGFWLALLDRDHKHISRGTLIARLVDVIGLEGQPPSVALSRRILATIKKELTEEHSKWDYELRTTLVEFACRLPVELLDEAGEGWPLDNPATQFFSETISRLLRVTQLRKLLLLLPTT